MWKTIKAIALGAVTAVSGFFVSAAHALTEAQETAIQAGFDTNQASGENVGVMVIMFVLALAVIGLIITMVKKH